VALASELIDSITTLVAAFAGAWFAFRFERKHKEADEVRRRVGAVNRALYTLMSQWSAMVQIRQEVIDPHRGRRDAWLNMAATVPGRHERISLEAGELSFLLEIDGQVYAEILLEEQRYNSAVHILEVRSNIILNEVWPRLAQAGVGIGAKRDEAEVERIIGRDATRKLKVIGEGLVRNVDENLKTLVAAYERLRAAVKKAYPKEKLINVEFVEKPPGGAAAA
jgi:hypothetical protein